MCGHIPGAVAFPSAWLGTVDAPEIERLLRSKGVQAGRSVVVYGVGPEDAVPLVAYLRGCGLTDVQTCHDGWSAWAADAPAGAGVGHDPPTTAARSSGARTR